MKLSVIIPVLNQFPLATTAIEFAMNNLAIPTLIGETGEWLDNFDVEFLVLDNGSQIPYEYPTLVNHLYKHLPKVIRLEQNIGVYPTFWEALKHTDADILAFIHSDLIIAEEYYDKRIIEAFESHPKLGMLGFIGSDEIDSSGGRGLGTTSNFLGGSYRYSDGLGKGNGHVWTGSPAEPHGKRGTGFTKAAVVDGCSMVFRRTALEQIAQREKFPPHHFYDRLLSCEVRELGYEVGVLGIGCDHISGQTVNQEPGYQTMAEAWSRAHIPQSQFRGNPPNWAWDMTVYAEAERQWLKEYRDEKHLVPCRV